MNKNESFQLELLTRLFLRLNGYFTTSLIIHSEKKGNIKKVELGILSFSVQTTKEGIENKPIDKYNFVSIYERRKNNKYDRQTGKM